jgi:hypothetical protein
MPSDFVHQSVPAVPSGPAHLSLPALGLVYYNCSVTFVVSDELMAGMEKEPLLIAGLSPLLDKVGTLLV